MTPVRVVPLAVMREVYSLPRDDGASSPRFQRYAELGPGVGYGHCITLAHEARAECPLDELVRRRGR